MRGQTNVIEEKEKPARKFKRILVAFDGSEYSNRALTVAEDLAKAHRSRLQVVYVIVPLVYSYGRMPSAEVERIERIANALVKKALEAVREANLDAKGEAIKEKSSVVQAITKYAAKEQVDLIVVGTRGIGGFRKLLLGSVSGGVVAHAPCSVLVVR